MKLKDPLSNNSDKRIYKIPTYIKKRSAEFLTSTLIIFAVIAVVEMVKSLKLTTLS